MHYPQTQPEAVLLDELKKLHLNEEQMQRLTRDLLDMAQQRFISFYLDQFPKEQTDKVEAMSTEDKVKWIESSMKVTPPLITFEDVFLNTLSFYVADINKQHH